MEMRSATVAMLDRRAGGRFLLLIALAVLYLYLIALLPPHKP